MPSPEREKPKRKLTAKQRQKRISEGLRAAWAFRKSRGLKWKKVP
jgi:hypothetical protein